MSVFVGWEISHLVLCLSFLVKVKASQVGVQALYHLRALEASRPSSMAMTHKVECRRSPLYSQWEEPSSQPEWMVQAQLKYRPPDETTSTA